MKELKAIERVMTKAERLSEKNISKLGEELNGNGRALGETNNDDGNGNSNKEKKEKTGKNSGNGHSNQN